MQTQEQREQSQPPFQPTASQNETAQALRATLEEVGQQRAFIIVAGLSGTGKTALLDNMATELMFKGARIAEARTILYPRDADEWVTTHQGPFVITATPFELLNVPDTATSKGFSPVITHILKTMTEADTATYVDSIMNRNKSSLSAQQIARYSLGVPLLAQHMLDERVDEATAIRMAADYLRSVSPAFYANVILKTVKPFLTMPIPDDVFESLRAMMETGSERHIYDTLYSALAEREALEKKGVHEESPFFIAPESENIYNAMLSARPDRHHAQIEIVAPNLQPGDLERIQQAFGHRYGRYDNDASTRRRMFRDADYRKAGLWSIDNEGMPTGYEAEVDMRDVFTRYRYALESGTIPLPVQNDSMFVLHKHAHPEFTNQVAAVGWMTESLLQQRSIAYFVNNAMVGKSYMYNPETKHIEAMSDILEV